MEDVEKLRHAVGKEVVVRHAVAFFKSYVTD